jgi:NNP family nitrate/nitrite transporter-like MFS transporter
MNDQEKPTYRWQMLFYLSAVNLVFNGIAVNVVPPLFPRISQDLNLNYAQIGSIIGALALGMLLFSLIGGVVADRFGMKNVISIAMFFASVFVAARGLADTYLTLWLFTLLMGITYGFIIPNLTKGIAMWFGPEELGRANGILLIGVFIGVAIGYALAAPLASAVGSWRNVMFLCGGACFLLWILWLIRAKEREYSGAIAQLMKMRPRPIEGLKRVFSVKEIWLLCLAELFVIGNMMAIGGIIPTFLVNKGMSENQAGVFVALNTLSLLFGLYTGPYFSDKVGIRKVFVWPFFLASAFSLPLLAILWGPPLYLINLLGGFVIGCATPQLRSIVMELEEIGPILSGSAFGALFTFNRIGGFIIPWLMGMVMTAYNAAIGIYVIAILAFIPVILILFVRETGRKRV